MVEHTLPKRIFVAVGLRARCDHALARGLPGSAAEKLLHALDCDTPVVRGA